MEYSYKSNKKISFKEVQFNDGSMGKRHFVIIANKVYDVSGFKHPGGSSVFENNMEDKYGAFYSIGHSKRAKDILSSLYVGDLAF